MRVCEWCWSRLCAFEGVCVCVCVCCKTADIYWMRPRVMDALWSKWGVLTANHLHYTYILYTHARTHTHKHVLTQTHLLLALFCRSRSLFPVGSGVITKVIGRLKWVLVQPVKHNVLSHTTTFTFKQTYAHTPLCSCTSPLLSLALLTPTLLPSCLLCEGGGRV